MVLHDSFGKPLKAEYVPDGLIISRTNPRSGEINTRTFANMLFQDLVDYYDSRIPNGDKYHYLSSGQKEFLDTGMVR